MTPPSSRIALSFVEINVTDWRGMVRWYSETIRLAPVLEDAEHRFALLDAGPARVALKGGGSTTAAHGPAPPAVRLVFEVPDLDAERERLARLGQEFGPAEESPEGYRAIRLRDPEGTPITLFAWS